MHKLNNNLHMVIGGIHPITNKTVPSQYDGTKVVNRYNTPEIIVETLAPHFPVVEFKTISAFGDAEVGVMRLSQLQEHIFQ